MQNMLRIYEIKAAQGFHVALTLISFRASILNIQRQLILAKSQCCVSHLDAHANTWMLPSHLPKGMYLYQLELLASLVILHHVECQAGSV